MSRTGHFFDAAGRVNPHIAHGAATYAVQQGLPRPMRTFGSVVAHPDVTARVGAAYNALPHWDEAAVPHFAAMREETGRQFDYLTRSRRRGGLGVDVQVTKTDPYSGPADMMRDLYNNRRLKVLSTASTGGHPFFTNDQNDQFRAVHDAFGHAGTGRGFDRHGEEAAFVAHSGMYTPLARRAMATETRGQNSAFISAGGGENFQPQKIALIPAHMATPLNPVLGRRTAPNATVLQARQFHSDAFPGVRMA